MKIFAVVNSVEGLVNGVDLRTTLKDAVDLAADLAAEQCDSGRKDIRAELDKGRSFTSNNGDIVVTVNECALPEPKRRGKPGRVRYKPIPLEGTVGKTVEAIVRDTVPGACGRDRVVRLLFSDGTQHGFVVPDDEDE